jgi:alpha-glucosidase
MALVAPYPMIDTVREDWVVRPEFFKLGSIYLVRIPIEEGTSLYGTGEIAGPLLRNGAITQTWNADSFAYDDANDHLYQSHPWVLAVRRDGSSFGVLADTTFRTWIDLRKGITFSTEGHSFPIIVIDADSPQGVLKRLALLTGNMPLPPLWALGYHQCRFSYYPDSVVRALADQFRSRKIPCDVIWLDINYMDGYRVFTFDPRGFPEPADTNAYLHSKGFKSVWMIDPGIKEEPGYFVYDEGTAGDHWVRTAQGLEYNGRVWPGPCAFPDFTRPETRLWWAGLYKDFMALGMDGVWNDMNEPSLFSTREGTMPEDNWHRGGGELPPGPHSQYHNVYGMLMVRATREGVAAANPDKRPFVLTRANYIGGHRYAATWTGDNVSNWEHLCWSVPMILNLGLSGQPFAGPDIGGFTGNASAGLYARWIGVGAFFPFSRGHKAMLMRLQEPWAYGPQVEATARTALERRYRLLPYLYTLFREASVDGLPVMRPVFFADPTDLTLRDEDHAFLLGADLLVEPQLTPEADYVFKEPQGIWRTVTLVGEEYAEDANQPVVKMRGGSIIPLGTVIQNTTERSLDPLTLLVALDSNEKAEGILYEDAGDGFEYQKGMYLMTTYEARRNGHTVLVNIRNAQGSMPRPQRMTHVELITDSGPVTSDGSETLGIEITVPDTALK